ncbi:hypothetical protein AGMMS49546_23000 [Spirochaetia bacterium]|nr:hypothetical protein AGMMS49546_23000 [Spirochaetia bacterium]
MIIATKKIMTRGLHFIQRKILALFYPKFSRLKNRNYICLYAGDIPKNDLYYGEELTGLSLSQNNKQHIKHDISNRHPLPDESVDVYLAEEVFEYIDYDKMNSVLQDIYRILKVNGLLRFSVTDYRCDAIYDRCQKDKNDKIIFDPLGGIWFPVYETVKKLLDKTSFRSIDFLHYYDENGNGHCNKIDYSKGYIQRTPDNDVRTANPYRPFSIVVDCYK